MICRQEHLQICYRSRVCGHSFTTSSGQANQYKFDLVANGEAYKIEANVYGNDFNGVVAEINSNSASTGITATVV